MGCGVGGPMREIVRFSGAQVTGINNNAYQVERLKLYNQKCGLSELTDAVKGDFMNLPFEEGTFDAIYAIEATVHAPKLIDVLKEIYRALKPGGVFASYEWLTTSEFDPQNEEHKRIVHDIQEGDGISHMQSITETLSDLKEVGFGKFDLLATF
jgi:sterol 24-C-methyltransferase